MGTRSMPESKPAASLLGRDLDGEGRLDFLGFSQAMGFLKSGRPGPQTRPCPVPVGGKTN